MIARKWILIVDDEPEVRQSLKELIQLSFDAETTKVVESKDGVEATGKLTQQMFDCIITDLKMPRKDGQALITSIRQNNFNSRTPIIVLSGFPDPALEAKHPFVYCLEKPFNHIQLTDAITTQLKIGKKGGRIGAEILNSLIGAVGTFLSHVYEDKKYMITSPKPKMRGTPLECDFVSKVEFTLQDAKHTFGILCSRTFVDSLSEATKAQNKDPQIVTSAMGKSILNYVLKSAKLLELKKINVTSFAMKDDPTFLVDRTGLIVTMKIDEDYVDIFASVEN